MEKHKFNNVIYNDYTCLENTLPGSSHAKKLVSRTRSLPLYPSSGKVASAVGTSFRVIDSMSLQQNNLLENTHLTPARADFGARRLSPVFQTAAEDAPKMDPQLFPAQSGTPSEDTSQHGSSLQCPTWSYERSKSFLLSHRRYSSITEKELQRILPAERNSLKADQSSEMGSYLKNNTALCKYNQAIVTDETITRQSGELDGIVFQQPRPASNSNVVRCQSDIRKDKCYRCVHTCRDAVRCLTCIWCLDAACYHCYKDDVGYSSWFGEMLTCEDSRAVKRNCRKWSLLGLATVMLPCVLLYPLLGGTLNVCLKCKKNEKQQDD